MVVVVVVVLGAMLVVVAVDTGADATGVSPTMVVQATVSEVSPARRVRLVCFRAGSG